VADYLHIPAYSLTIKKLQWLGLFSDTQLPLGLVSVLEMFAYLLKKKLVYARGESDLLVQHHEFEAAYPGDRTERIQATLIHVGDPGGDTAMSRTVGLPVAIATRLIAEGEIGLTGVRIPVVPELYRPVLAELATRGIRFVERRIEITPENEKRAVAL
jgi:saccharopine dehydrogenase-like NADP-dependent oxidoreductase